MRIKLRHVEVLISLSEAGSIRAAARLLGLSQPALSKVIRQMENDFNVPLIARTPRGAILTEFGQTVLSHARVVQADVRRLEDEIDRLRGRQKGMIALAVSPLASILIIPAVLPAFCAKYPDIDVRITEGIYPTVLAPLREGLLDFAVGPTPPTFLAAELEFELLLEAEIVVMGRFGHPAGKARSLRELVKRNWLTLGPAGSLGDLFIEAFEAQGLKPPKATIKLESFATALALVETTDFLCVLPRKLVSPWQAQRRLQAIELVDQLPKSRIALIKRSTVPLSPAAQYLSTLIRRRGAAIARQPEAITLGYRTTALRG